MQVAQPCGSGGHICRMGDLTSLIKAQLQVNLHLLGSGESSAFLALVVEMNCTKS